MEFYFLHHEPLKLPRVVLDDHLLQMTSDCAARLVGAQQILIELYYTKQLEAKMHSRPLGLHVNPRNVEDLTAYIKAKESLKDDIAKLFARDESMWWWGVTCANAFLNECVIRGKKRPPCKMTVQHIFVDGLRPTQLKLPLGAQPTEKSLGCQGHRDTYFSTYTGTWWDGPPLASPELEE